MVCKRGPPAAGPRASTRRSACPDLIGMNSMNSIGMNSMNSIQTPSAALDALSSSCSVSVSAQAKDKSAALQHPLNTKTRLLSLAPTLLRRTCASTRQQHLLTQYWRQRCRCLLLTECSGGAQSHAAAGLPLLHPEPSVPGATLCVSIKHTTPCTAARSSAARAVRCAPPGAPALSRGARTAA